MLFRSVDNSDHVGGNYLATVSFKSTFPNPIPESLRATSLVFFDLGDIWGVDYSKLVPDLILAIQEQQTIITSLTSRIAVLEAKGA